MAYNNLSGNVLQPTTMLPRKDINGNIVIPIVSGNLSTSDGASVINVPRVSNATNNSIITNVDGDANTLTCESNLTFDGDTLNVVGDLTSSLGVSGSSFRTATTIIDETHISSSLNISASAFFGDGSRLTGLNVGSGGGIFTQVAANAAFSTSSIAVGANVTPAATMHVVGSSFMSGAIVHKRKFVDSDYSVSITDYYIGVDTDNSTVKLTLPVASSMLDGQTIIVKDEGGVANVNNITISGSASDTIDGQNTVILESPFASIQLYCNGTNKFFIC